MQNVEKWEKEMQGKGKKEGSEGEGLAVEHQRLQFPAAPERREDVPEREEEEMH